MEKEIGRIGYDDKTQLKALILAASMMSPKERLDSFLDTGNYDYIAPGKYKKSNLYGSGKQATGFIKTKKGLIREEPKIGRNDPCKCGSGKKYKKCCGK